MAVFDVTPQKLGRELERRARRTRAALDRGLRAGANRGMRHLKRVTRDKDKIYLGQFRNSFSVIKGKSGWELVNLAPHAGIVELGARPHPVSPAGIDAIARWAELKLGLDEDEAKGVAFAIAQKIRAQGQAPTYIFRENLPELTRLAKLEVERCISQESRKGPKGGGA